MLVYGGDDRFFNNIFVGQRDENKHRGSCGTKAYESYRDNKIARKTMDNDTPAADIGETLPVKMRDNLYLNGAVHWTHEQNPHIASDFHAELTIAEEEGHFWLCTNLGGMVNGLLADRVTTTELGKAFEPDQAYENRDGSPVLVDSDFSDCPRAEKTTVGPFEHYSEKIFLA